MPTIARSLTAIVALAGTACAQLAGTYFINPTFPQTSATFQSLAAAVNALNLQGVSGSVEFLIYDDAGPYTEASPFVANNAGGTYGVPSGTGPSTAVLVMASWGGTSPTNRVTFRPAAGEHVVIDATGQACGIFWGGADYVTVKDLEIMGAAYDGISLYAESQHGTALDPIIDGCRIHDIGGPAVTIYGNTPPPTNTTVQNCFLWRCQTMGNGPFGTTGRFGYVCTRRSVGTRILHNTFYVDTLFNNASYGVLSSQTAAVTEVPYDEVSNNIVVKLAGPLAPLIHLILPSGTQFPVPIVCESNCYWDTSGGAFAAYGNPATAAMTLADWQLGALRDLQSLAADPMLRDVAAHDLHLTITAAGPSPCIGASTAGTNVPFDLDGQQRITAIDIGADEFGASQFSAVGTGCPGTGGLVPTLQLYRWPFLGGELSLGFEHMPANTFGFVFGSLGIGPVPIPIGGGCNAYLDLGSFVGLGAAIGGPAGTGSVVFQTPASPVFIGFELAYQGIVLDAGAPLGLTVTNAIDIVLDF